MSSNAHSSLYNSGMIIWDVPLIKRSMKNELLSILLCIVLGMIVGGFCAWTDMATAWPTKEMLGRGSPMTFYAGECMCCLLLFIFDTIYMVPHHIDIYLNMSPARNTNCLL